MVSTQEDGIARSITQVEGFTAKYTKSMWTKKMRFHPRRYRDRKTCLSHTQSNTEIHSLPTVVLRSTEDWRLVGILGPRVSPCVGRSPASPAPCCDEHGPEIKSSHRLRVPGFPSIAEKSQQWHSHRRSALT